MRSAGSLDPLANDFDFLAEADPMYAVLHEKGKRRRQWNPEEFFATGKAEIEDLLARVAQHGLPREWRSAMDFGCGLGRLSRPLSEHFEAVTGVDLSGRMITLASQIHAENAKLQFVLNTQPNLAAFADDSFDLVYTNKVLQHQPSSEVVLSYFTEFVRVLRPGGLLAAQVPERMSIVYKLFNRRRQFLLLRRLGVNPRRLLDRFALHPVRMIHVSREEVVAAVQQAGGRVIDIQNYLPEGPTYVATKG